MTIVSGIPRIRVLTMHVTECHSKSSLGPGGVLPYNSYTGMRRPTGSYFSDSDLKRGIIFKPFSRTGYNFSNARKLQNIIGDFNSRTGY